MANSFNVNDVGSFAGLGSFAYTVPTGTPTSFVTLACQTTIPQNSGLQMVLSQTGSASVSATIGGSALNPTPTQPSMGTSIRVLAVAGDVLTVALTSTALADQQPGAIKSIVNLFQGE